MSERLCRTGSTAQESVEEDKATFIARQIGGLKMRPNIEDRDRLVPGIGMSLMISYSESIKIQIFIYIPRRLGTVQDTGHLIFWQLARRRTWFCDKFPIAAAARPVAG